MVRLMVAAVVVALALAGCMAPRADAPSRLPDLQAASGSDQHQARASTHALSRRAARELDLMQVGPRHPGGAPFHRDGFGSSWADTDGNGCNQRDDVLVRDAVPGSVTTAPQGRCDHDVLAGVWIDPYTGRRIELDDLKQPSQAMAVQIDHIVPLAEAWTSGAWRWPDRRRVRFANDLDELLAVDGPTNAAKGDDDPAAWRPRKGFQCRYAAEWIAAKHHYRLTADVAEIAALREMLGFC